jgi:hypothetical protein
LRGGWAAAPLGWVMEALRAGIREGMPFLYFKCILGLVEVLLEANEHIPNLGRRTQFQYRV